jgi:hypothetical protein
MYNVFRRHVSTEYVKKNGMPQQRKMMGKKKEKTHKHAMYSGH